eukprot:5308362-Lingulodinium_polyedra.AAC.1
MRLGPPWNEDGPHRRQEWPYGFNKARDRGHLARERAHIAHRDQRGGPPELGEELADLGQPAL